MARILVTGGTGYIGSHTVVELMQQGYDVTIVDNLSNSSVDVLDGISAIVGRRPEFANIDCNDYVNLEAVFKQYPDIVGVIHFAAEELAHQLRLRDIGGIIIVDFIDMDSKEHRQSSTA